MALKFVHLTIINVGYKVYNQYLFLRILSVGVQVQCIFKPKPVVLHSTLGFTEIHKGTS